MGLRGSCGKTTTKALIASILRLQGETLATVGTLNNQIGVPQTLLQLKPTHQFAVIEMGTNHPGEIAYLTSLVQPDVALITNIGPSHLEFLHSVEGVAKEKGAIFQRLKTNGIAILNADDPFSKSWQPLLHNHRIISFGIENKADITAKNIQFNSAGQAEFNLITPQGDITIQLPLLGTHQVMNAVATAAVAVALDLSLQQIKQGLERAEPVGKRMVTYRGINGAVIIDDSYNANPLSVRAALQVLSQAKNKKILVLGDMGELGENSSQFHRKIGEEARQYGIEQLYTCGQLTRQTTTAFGKNAFHFDKQQDLIATLQTHLTEQMTVLVKGSRFMKMENVVAALTEA